MIFHRQFFSSKYLKVNASFYLREATGLILAAVLFPYRYPHFRQVGPTHLILPVVCPVFPEVQAVFSLSHISTFCTSRSCS